MFSHRETTSKGIRVSDLQACKCIFPGQRSDTFEQATYVPYIPDAVDTVVFAADDGWWCRP